MSRIRTIKPDFWKNEDLSALPEATHMLAAALLNYADDEGYFNANVGLIKGEVLPLRDPSVTIHDSLTALKNVGYLRLGEGTNGKRYGHIVHFMDHQVINRPKQSKIKDLEIVWDDARKNHGSISDSSPPEGNKERKGKEPPQPPQGGSRFDEFWNEYPHRGEHPDPKKPAREKFDRRVKDGADPQAIIDGAKRYSALVGSEGIEGRLVCQAVTWLNQERWNDAPTVRVETPDDIRKREERDAATRRVQDALRAAQDRATAERLARYSGDAPEALKDLAEAMPDFLRRGHETK